MAYMCEVCGQACPCVDSQLAHFLATHGDPESTECPFCDLAGVSIDEMRMHIEYSHPVSPDASQQAAHVAQATGLTKAANQNFGQAFGGLPEGRTVAIQMQDASHVNATGLQACAEFLGGHPDAQSSKLMASSSSCISDKVFSHSIPKTSSSPAVRQEAISQLDVDDGRTRTVDAILQVRSWLSATGSVVVRPKSPGGALAVDRNCQAGTSGSRKGASVWLCTTCDHLSSGAGDAGWGCGYRNTQMLLSALMHDLTYNNVLFDGRHVIPSIHKIQKLIESAWRSGFDPAGAKQLGGVLVRTRKWIGASDIWTFFTSLRVRCQLVDFHRPSGPRGTHPKLLEWAKAYFQTERDFTPPIYFQHQGHSRTIIGYAETASGEGQLLLFDPSVKSRKGGQPLTAGELVKRCTLDDLTCEQYQMLTVTGIMSSAERDASKIIRSTRVP